MECVNQCEQVINSADSLIDQLKEESLLQQEINKKQAQSISDKDKELNAFYRDPLVMSLIGAAAAALIIKR